MLPTVRKAVISLAALTMVLATTILGLSANNLSWYADPRHDQVKIWNSAWNLSVPLEDVDQYWYNTTIDYTPKLFTLSTT